MAQQVRVLCVLAVDPHPQSSSQLSPVTPGPGIQCPPPASMDTAHMVHTHTSCRAFVCIKTKPPLIMVMKIKSHRGSCDVSQCAPAYSPSVHPFTVHCNESLVWFKASAALSGSSRGLLSVILLLCCVMEVLQLWTCRTGPFKCSRRSDVGMDQLKNLDLGLAGG